MKTRSRWYRLLLLLALPLIWRLEPPPPEKKIPVKVTMVPSVATLGPGSLSISAPESFHDFAQETLLSLPERKNLAGEIHHTPTAVLEGGQAVGKVAEWLKERQRDPKEGLPFYQACAERDSVLTAVRAVCLKRYLDLGGEKGPQFSARLLWLAEQLPTLRD